MTALPWVESDGGRAAAGLVGDTRDCVVRAIAIAAELGYRDVYDELYRRANAARLRRDRHSPRLGVAPAVYRGYLAELGAEWTPTMQVGGGCRVHLAVGELPARGRLVVRLSRHAAAVVDGVVFDTYDPSRNGTRCVYGYWTFGWTRADETRADELRRLPPELYGLAERAELAELRRREIAESIRRNRRPA